MSSQRAVIELRKYSWAVTDGMDGKPNYEHLTARNLFMLLEWSFGDSTGMSLSIVQGTTTINNIDLGAYIDLSLQTERQAAAAGQSIITKRLPMYAISSEAKLAISHHTQDGMVHRMQVTTLKAEDCDKVVLLLRNRGMAFAQPNRNVRTGTVDTDLRPPSTVAGFSMDQTPAAPYNLRSRKSAGAQSAYNQPFNPFKESKPLFESKGFTPLSQTTKRSDSFLVRDETSAPRMPLENFSMPTQIHRRPLFEAQPLSNTQLGSGPSYSSLSHSSNTNRYTISVDKSSSWTTYQRPPELDYDPITTPYDEKPRQSASVLQKQRTSSSVEYRTPQASEQPIDRLCTERTRSSSLSMAPLPKPKPADARSSTPAEINTDSTALQLHTGQKRSYSEAYGSDQPSREYEALNAVMLPPARPSESSSTSSPKTMEQLLSKYGKSHRKEHVHQSKSHAESGQMHESEQQLQNAPTGHEGASHSSSTSLEEYAKLPDGQRTRALEQFMMRMLGSKDFAKLCEDMSSCWQRLAPDL